MRDTWNQGVCDPHIHIFENKAYMYASHDASILSKRFVMPDWWVWSSEDLIHWEKRCVLKPEETYIKKPLDGCFATDAIEKNGKYYWVFSDMSDGGSQIGIVESENPTGPWVDMVGGPLVPRNAKVAVYDPALYKEDNEVYLVFGKGDYFIARLSDDMRSLAEEPAPIEIKNPAGPYGPGWTDDKPCLHRYQDHYFLSWGCYYAMSKKLYGPYEYTGCLFDEKNISKSFQKATWPNGLTQGRHGNFFEWKNQWYFTYCDMSETGNRYFRNSWISYVHYRDNGEIAPIVVEDCGVDQYFAECGKIPAANYAMAEGICKKELEDGTFGIWNKEKDACVYYPNILHVKPTATLILKFSGEVQKEQQIRVVIGNGKERTTAETFMKGNMSFSMNLSQIVLEDEKIDLFVSFIGKESDLILESILIKN